MIVKFKKLVPEATIPCYAKQGDAGLDLIATSIDRKDDVNTYHTGLAVEIPEGYVGLLFPRSSVVNYDLILANGVGVIDSGYRGEIMCKFKKTFELMKSYRVGDKVAQLIIIPYPTIEIEECTNLTETERGEGGFGHTGV